MKPAAIETKLQEARELASEENFAEALPRFEELTRLCPGSAMVWLEYAAVASHVRQGAAAERARSKARELASNNPKLLLQLGHQYQAARQPAQARACYEQAAQADPRDVNCLVSLAVMLEKDHQLDQSRVFVEKCLALDSSDEQARYFAALLDRRQKNLVQAESRLRDLIASDPKHPYVCYACRYELAQVLDQTGRFDEAMAMLEQAKAMVRKLANIGEVYEAFDAMSERIRHVKEQPKNAASLWAKAFPPKEREPGPTVAFLGGHPRSGTTLMEQILGTHPQIAALDEPHLFQSVLMQEFPKVRPLSPARLNVLRRLYRKALQEEFGPGAEGKLLLEKNPSLTTALPMWLRIFPDLRVIIALRDPRDVVVSCYFQNLPLNVANANFLTLERVARHYAGLMDVWRAVREWEGVAWMETRYEDTIADLEKEGRKVTEFLGLAWDEEQAKFYQHSRERRLNSPTYHEVTQPIHARSVARWQPYEKYLQPILPVLEPYCQLFGYS